MKSNKIAVGILAHVDAGKTTLAESLLYLSGAIRTIGRVDHKNAFLDTYELEKARGITIFSKQAELIWKNLEITLLDTPGHVDFSAEMERTLQVLDYAILVINGMDGVQGHVMTLWKLLKQYKVPVFLFVNKMDQEGTSHLELLRELQEKLDYRCISFSEENLEVFLESLAICDETLMEHFLETEDLPKEKIVHAIEQRTVFPCYFGSALKLTGVEELLDGIKTYIKMPDYGKDFAARVYKISRDSQGNRLTYLKVTGDELRVKMPLKGMGKNGDIWEEKADQIRIYSGEQYESVQMVPVGTICAVTGLNYTYAGEGLGRESSLEKPYLEPVLNYGLQLPPEHDLYVVYKKLSILEEEDPLLHILWKEEANEIQIQVMGDIQIEILKSIILERFQIPVEFKAGSIVYKESIQDIVEGIGHFEPLRHYAEVHLLMEPLPCGSGMIYETSCSEDILEKSWQHLVLTHLEEKRHRGVLTGSEITDIKVTLVTGRAHQKHTEGGDFREATYRAVRQGLRKANSILLEPIYEFQLEVPTDKIGRAMSDIQRMHGSFLPPFPKEKFTIITGKAPVATMCSYHKEVISYTKGEGRLSCALGGYEPCHNAEEVIAKKGYDADTDVKNPTGSVFCSHGAGFPVAWNEVERYMHLETCLKSVPKKETEPELKVLENNHNFTNNRPTYTEEELEEIFTRTYGVPKKRMVSQERTRVYTKSEKAYVYKPKQKLEEYLLVDGYNIIFDWKELKEMAKTNLAGARDKLCELLCNYQGYKDITIIVVFDAYQTENLKSRIEQYQNIYIVYTKKAETADQYIEATVKQMNKKYQVTVATSDAMEQMIIWGLGGLRLSAVGLREELEHMKKEIREIYLEKEKRRGDSPFDNVKQIGFANKIIRSES